MLGCGVASNGKAKGQCPQHRKVNEHEQHRKHRISDWGFIGLMQSQAFLTMNLKQRGNYGYFR